MRILKYPLPHRETTVTMPEDSSVLTAQEQAGTVVLWVIAGLEPEQPRTFVRRPTGATAEPGDRYIATIQHQSPDWLGFVTHVFERPSLAAEA